MKLHRTALILAACGAVIRGAGAAARQDSPPVTPKTDHAVGYYDEQLRRVVLVGAAGDPRDGQRDSVWSWEGRRWELVAEAGPPGRVVMGK